LKPLDQDKQLAEAGFSEDEIASLKDGKGS
jgi:hypothetical protein